MARRNLATGTEWLLIAALIGGSFLIFRELQKKAVVRPEPPIPPPPIPDVPVEPDRPPELQPGDTLIEEYRGFTINYTMDQNGDVGFVSVEDVSVSGIEPSLDEAMAAAHGLVDFRLEGA